MKVNAYAHVLHNVHDETDVHLYEGDHYLRAAFNQRNTVNRESTTHHLFFWQELVGLHCGGLYTCQLLLGKNLCLAFC